MIQKPKWIKLTSKKRLFVFILIGLVMLSVLGTSSVLIVRHYQGQSNTPQSAEEIYKTKKAELENKIDTTKNADEKLGATQELAQLAANNADTKTGLEYAKKAAELSSTVNNNALLGFLAKQSGDNQLAIEAYKKAAELSPTSDDPRSDYMYYTSRWQILEAQQ